MSPVPRRRFVPYPFLAAALAWTAGCAASADEPRAAAPPSERSSAPPSASSPVAAGSALAPDLQRVVEAARRESRVRAHVEAVTAIGPRLTGSENADRACEWAREQFESFGLDAKVEKWGEFPVQFDRGPSSGRVLEPVAKELDFGTNAWTAGTVGPVAARAEMRPATVEEAEERRERLRGAWIVDPPPPARAASAPAASAPAASAPSAADRAKVDSLLDSIGIAGRVQAARGDLIHTSGNYRVRPEALPTRVTIRLRGDQHREIADWLRAGREVRLEFDVANRFGAGPVPVKNVIADWRGSELPDEYVVVGGHLDSWDGATGATDNGTGVATTLEAARLIAAAGVKPKRTIRFMLWTGEEQGLLGSLAWVRAHAADLPKISAALVHDEGTNYVAAIPATASQRAVLEPALAGLATLDPSMPFRIDTVDELPRPGSDHEAFLAAGVPGFFWVQEGRAVYTRTHHTQHDKLDAVIDEYQRHSAVVIACVAVAVANLEEKIPRDGLGAPRRGGPRRSLGVQLGDGLTIEVVTPDSLAERAGLQPGDVLRRVGDEAVADAAEFRRVIRRAPDRVILTVRRGDRDVAVPVHFTPRPASAPASGPVER